MRKILIRLFLVSIFTTNINCAFSQLKVYEGNYANGFAKYTYIENEDMTRTFEGDFLYFMEENKDWFIKGKFKNNLKEGKWFSNLWGINEIVNYRAGKRDGDYFFKYKENDVEINIYAHFSDNKIDSLSHYSSDNTHGVIRGYVGKNSLLISPWVQFAENTILSQFFNKNIHVGSMLQDKTTGDTNRSLESISGFSALLDKVLNSDGTIVVDNEYYNIESFDYVNHIYPDIFTPKITYLPEKSLIPVLFYHSTLWDSSLTRGEIPVDYYPIFEIQKDEEKTNEEKNKKIKEEIYNNQRRKQVEDSISKEFSKRESKFNNSDLGRMINILRPHTALSDFEFEQKKLECLNSTISRCELGPIYKESNGESGFINLNCHYNSLIKNQIYDNVELPKELYNSQIIVIPTEFGFKETEWCVSKAMIIYINDEISSLIPHILEYGTYLDKTIDSNGNESICRGKIQVKKVSDKFIFNSSVHTPRGFSDIILVPIKTEKIQQGKCYYSFWTNRDKSIVEATRKLTKSEVDMTFKERLLK